MGQRQNEKLAREVRPQHAEHDLGAVDEGVVADVRDIDMCMILGAGWGFHLGGIAPYLDRYLSHGDKLKAETERNNPDPCNHPPDENGTRIRTLRQIGSQVKGATTNHRSDDKCRQRSET